MYKYTLLKIFNVLLLLLVGSYSASVNETAISTEDPNNLLATSDHDELEDYENIEDIDERFGVLLERQKSYVIDSFTKINWFTAQQNCASQGMALASVNTPTEGESLRRFLEDNQMLSENNSFWISGSDLTNFRNWYWFGNGRPILYKNWAHNEPSTNGRCVLLDDNAKWRAANCLSNAYFICENRSSLDSYSFRG